MAEQLLCTTVVGSYPQPVLGSRVPRVPTRALWRIPEECLEQAQDNATLLAVRAMERAKEIPITNNRIAETNLSPCLLSPPFSTSFLAPFPSPGP